MRRALTAMALATASLALMAVAPGAVAARTATLTLNPAVGPPTTLTKAKGTGFAPQEVVAFYFDGSRIGSTLTGPTGKFNARLTVPASARPGEHSVEAVGQTSGGSAQAGFLARTDWLQGCFEGGRSCFNPYENVLGPDTVGGLTPAWRAQIGADGGSSPVDANGRLFVGGAAGLYGLDPTTGAIIVICRTAARVVTTPAVIRGVDPQPDPPGKVVFGSSDGNLYAMSTDGEPLWQVGLGASPASPLVIQAVGDPTIRVVVGAGNTLFAFDGDGNRLWATVLEGGDISKAPALLALPGEPEQVIAAAGNALYALDAATGRIIWGTAPSRSPLGTPAVGDPHLIGDPNLLVGDQAGSLFSIDPLSGAVRATFAARGSISGSPAGGAPNQSDPWVILGDGGGNIYAADQTDGFPPPVWEAALGGPVDGPPVLANGVVYVATDPEIGDPHIFALDQAT